MGSVGFGRNVEDHVWCFRLTDTKRVVITHVYTKTTALRCVFLGNAFKRVT